MTHAPAPAAEPRHTRGGAGGAAVAEADGPRWLRQKVKVPNRVWGAGRYSPGAIAWHAQITALQQRPEHCRASVATLAGYMGDGKRTGERYLAELAVPGSDGIPELTTIRHTGADGDGETAERYTRPVGLGDHFALVPVAAAKVLRHPLFVLYCALAYAVATRTPVTAAELASLLGVTDMTARRMTNELEHLGWITVHRRTGAHGRHDYEIHDQPLHLVPDTDTPADMHSDGGSGAYADGGSLAYKEDARLTDPRGTTEARGSLRRRRGTGSRAANPVDTAGNTGTADGPVAPAAFLRPATPPRPRPYDGPPLTLSPRVWWVLQPLHDLLPAVRPFVMRRIGREIGRQLDTGIHPDDIRDQLQLLRAWTPSEDIRDPGRWILGAALPLRPSRCGLTDCVRGRQRFTGAPCKACAEPRHPPHTQPPPHPQPTGT